MGATLYVCLAFTLSHAPRRARCVSPNTFFFHTMHFEYMHAHRRLPFPFMPLRLPFLPRCIARRDGMGG